MEQFHYLLNAFERAAQADKPADAGYAEKRAALIAHLEALDKDSERYRWLRERWGRIATTLHMDGEVEIFVNESLSTPEAELLDEAIDAAMKGANNQVQP